MSLALSAVILILILLPGAVAINSYYSSFELKAAYVSIPFNDLLFKGLIVSLLMHMVGVGIAEAMYGRFDFNLLYNLVAGKDAGINNNTFSKDFSSFSKYIIVITIVAWFSGKAAKKIVRYFDLDVKYYSFRTTNYWFSLFSARNLEGKDVKGKSSDTDLIFVDVLTNENIIYSGILVDFNYSSRKDQLENVILGSTVKRNFIQSEEERTTLKNHSTGQPCQIPGDSFIIPSSSILNINISYIEIESREISQR